MSVESLFSCQFPMMRQKDTILRFVSDAERIAYIDYSDPEILLSGVTQASKACDMLMVVRELWTESDYRYKYIECVNRINDLLRQINRMAEENGSKLIIRTVDFAVKHVKGHGALAPIQEGVRVYHQPEFVCDYCDDPIQYMVSYKQGPIWDYPCCPNCNGR